MKRKAALKKNCRIDYVNKYSLLVDYSTGNDTIVYYEYGLKDLNSLYSNYSFSVKNDLPIDLYPFSFFPYPIKNTH